MTNDNPDLEYVQQIIDYCLTITAELIERGVVQTYENDIFPCVENPITKQEALKIKAVREQFDDSEIEVVTVYTATARQQLQQAEQKLQKIEAFCLKRDAMPDYLDNTEAIIHPNDILAILKEGKN